MRFAPAGTQGQQEFLSSCSLSEENLSPTTVKNKTPPFQAGRPRVVRARCKDLFAERQKQIREHRTQDGPWPQVPSTRHISTKVHQITPRKSKRVQQSRAPGPLPDCRALVICVASSLASRWHCFQERFLLDLHAF